MSTVAMSGNDTIILNNQLLNDLADGDCVDLTFPNEIMTVKIGKNGNAIFGLNQMGTLAEVKIRVIRGSFTDKFLNNLLVQQNSNFSGFVLLFGQFIKKIGDGAGNITSDTYILSSGAFSKEIEAKSNVEGEATQSVSMYSIKFANAARAIT